MSTIQRRTMLLSALLASSALFAEEAPVVNVPASEAVLRASQSLYNVFVANQTQTKDLIVSGDATIQDLFVQGNQTINGNLTVSGAQTFDGGNNIIGAFTQSDGNVSINADAAAATLLFGTGAAAKTVTVGSSTVGSHLTLNGGTTSAAGGIDMGAALTTGTINIGGAAQTGLVTLGNSAVAGNIAVGATNHSGTQTINMGTGTGAQAINIGESATAASTLVLEAGTTGKILYNVGASTGTNYQLNPVGSAETAAQRMAWARFTAAGVTSASSGVNSFTSAPSAGVFTFLWSNTFAAAPTATVSITGSTGGQALITTDVSGATVTTLNSIGGALALPFAVVAIGS